MGNVGEASGLVGSRDNLSVLATLRTPTDPFRVRAAGEDEQASRRPCRSDAEGTEARSFDRSLPPSDQCHHRAFHGELRSPSGAAS